MWQPEKGLRHRAGMGVRVDISCYLLEKQLWGCVRPWTPEWSKKHLPPRESSGSYWGLLETAEMVGRTHRG